MDQNTGIIIWLPAGKAHCELFEIDFDDRDVVGERGVGEAWPTLELALVAQVDDRTQAEILDDGSSGAVMRAGSSARYRRPVRICPPADVVQPPASRTLKQPSTSRWPRTSVDAGVTLVRLLSVGRTKL